MLWVGFVLGVIVVVFATASLVTTFVLPRGGSRFQAMPLLIGRAVRHGLLLVARPARSFARKDGLLAGVGPVTLIAQLAVFLGLYILGYGLMQWPWTRSFQGGISESGASLFSVGLVHASASGNDVIVVIAGATGAIAIALQIGYLPAIYQAFNRRESLIPPWNDRVQGHCIRP